VNRKARPVEARKEGLGLPDPWPQGRNSAKKVVLPRTNYNLESCRSKTIVFIEKRLSCILKSLISTSCLCANKGTTYIVWKISQFPQ